MISERGKKLLIVDKYSFRKSKETPSGVSYRCTKSGCPSQISVDKYSEYLNSESQIGKWLRYTFGLLFLQPDDVGKVFAEDLYSIIPENARVIQYADYLVDNYISNDSSFPPDIWACCDSSTERTTNACESFHSHFNSSFYCTHPDIFRFITVLLDIQLNSYIKINSVHLPTISGNSAYKKRQQYVSHFSL